jgi:hypothetical protein
VSLHLSPDALAALTSGCGRGYTVLCTIPDAGLLDTLAAIAGTVGLVLAAGIEPIAGPGWSAVRCDPAVAIPLRSHIVDAAVLVGTPELSRLAGELRRTLVPGGDVRVLLDGEADAVAALAEAAVERCEWRCGVRGKDQDVTRSE